MLHACDFCTRVRWLAYSPLARRRCPAQVCIPAMARRARVTCTCGSCLAVRVLAARDCISPVADTHCVRLRLAADAVSPNVVQFVFSLRATTSRPSPILAARNYVSPVADAVPMPVFLHAWRACAMCTCGRCLAFSLNVITIPFVFKRVHMHATSHQPVHTFLQACCTCMLSACDCIPARVFTRTRRVPAGLKTRCSRLRAARRRCPAAACMPVLLAS